MTVEEPELAASRYCESFVVLAILSYEENEARTPVGQLTMLGSLLVCQVAEGDGNDGLRRSARATETASPFTTPRAGADCRCLTP